MHACLFPKGPPPRSILCVHLFWMHPIMCHHQHELLCATNYIKICTITNFICPVHMSTIQLVFQNFYAGLSVLCLWSFAFYKLMSGFFHDFWLGFLTSHHDFLCASTWQTKWEK